MVEQGYYIIHRKNTNKSIKMSKIGGLYESSYNGWRKRNKNIKY